MPALCTCTHTDAQHTKADGPCQADDSYGAPCECPSFEPSRYHNDAPHQATTEDLHWGPQLGGHTTPEDDAYQPDTSRTAP